MDYTAILNSIYVTLIGRGSILEYFATWSARNGVVDSIIATAVTLTDIKTGIGVLITAIGFLSGIIIAQNFSFWKW